MAASVKRIDTGKLISYSDDLVEVFKNGKDINNLNQCMEGSKILQSSCNSDFVEVQNLLQEYQEKIDGCKQKIDGAKSVLVEDPDLDLLQKQLEQELEHERLLQEELRVVSNDISDLEYQMVSIEEQKQILKKLEKDKLKAQKKVSMYASVTNIVPHLDDLSKICGHIVERDRRKVEKFEFEPAKAATYEICNSLWRMITR